MPDVTAIVAFMDVVRDTKVNISRIGANSKFGLTVTRCIGQPARPV
jgi:hypothetical protein